MHCITLPKVPSPKVLTISSATQKRKVEKKGRVGKEGTGALDFVNLIKSTFFTEVKTGVVILASGLFQKAVYSNLNNCRLSMLSMDLC